MPLVFTGYWLALPSHHFGGWPGAAGAPSFSGAGGGGGGAASGEAGADGMGIMPSVGPAGGAGGGGAPSCFTVLKRAGSMAENQSGACFTDFQGPLGLLPR